MCGLFDLPRSKSLIRGAIRVAPPSPSLQAKVAGLECFHRSRRVRLILERHALMQSGIASFRFTAVKDYRVVVVTYDIGSRPIVYCATYTICNNKTHDTNQPIQAILIKPRKLRSKWRIYCSLVRS